MADGSIWGRTNEIGAVFHRLAAIAFGPRPTACGRTIDVASAYQCAPADAEPVIGEVCPVCRRAAEAR